MQNKNQISMPIISKKKRLIYCLCNQLLWPDYVVLYMRFSTNITIYAAYKSRELSGNLDIGIPEI